MADFDLKAYEELKKSIANAFDKFHVHYKVVNDEQLPSPRREQVKFIRTVIVELDKQTLPKNEKEIPEAIKNRAKVLTGISLIIAADIQNNESSYSLKGSYLLPLLLEAVGINESNELDAVSHTAVLSAAQRFISTRIFANGTVSSKLLESHIFSPTESAKFKLTPNVWNVCSAEKAKAETGILSFKNEELAKMIKAREAAEKKANGSSASGIWGWFKKGAVKEEVKEAEKKADTTATCS